GDGGGDGIVAAQAVAATGGVQPDGEPHVVGGVVQADRVALGGAEGGLAVGAGEAGEGGAAVGRDGRARNVDRVEVAPAGVVVGRDDGGAAAPDEGLALGDVGRRFG